METAKVIFLNNLNNYMILKKQHADGFGKEFENM
jgi:hypothetical protein